MPAPTITSVQLSSTGRNAQNWLKKGSLVTASVNFSEDVFVSGSPMLNFSVGSTLVQAPYVSGGSTTASKSKTLKFLFTVGSGLFDGDGIAISSTALTLDAISSIRNAGTQVAVTSMANPPVFSDFKVDTIAPILSYTEGNNALTVIKGVTQKLFFGTNEGGTAYLVAEGYGLNNISSLATNRKKSLTLTQAQSNASLDLSGLISGPYKLWFEDAAGNVSSSAKTIRIDTSAPTVVGTPRISSASGVVNKVLNTGDVATVQVEFSEALAISGTPQIALNIGGTTVLANYANTTVVTGKTMANFVYAVAAGLRDANGISIDANSLRLNGGSIKDLAGNTAVISHGRALDNSEYLVESIASTGSGVSAVKVEGWDAGDNRTLNMGQTLTFLADFAAPVMVAGTPRLKVQVGASTVQAIAVKPVGATTTQLKFVMTVGANLSDTNGISLATSPFVTTATDRIYNPVTKATVPLALPAATQFTGLNVDSLMAHITQVTLSDNRDDDPAKLKSGDLVYVDVRFSEAVSAPASSTIKLLNGAQELFATYVSGNGSSVLRYAYTIESNVSAATGLKLAASPFGTMASNAIQDNNGLPAVLTFDYSTIAATLPVDALAPTVTNVELTGQTGARNGVLGFADTITATATFSENVQVDGAPVLKLGIGNAVVNAQYLSGSGTDTLEFIYNIADGLRSTNGVSIVNNAVRFLDGSSIKDLDGNLAILNSAAKTPNNAYVVNAIETGISSLSLLSVQGASASNVLNTGDTVTFSVLFNKNVNISGTPRLALNVGGATVYANYVTPTATTNNSGVRFADFVYTVASGDTDPNGIQLASESLDLNGATILDKKGAAVNLLHGGLFSPVNLLVDTTPPTQPLITINSRVADGMTNQEFLNGISIFDYQFKNEESIQVTITGHSGQSIIKTFNFLTPSGSYALTQSELNTLGAGNATLVAKGTDSAGNMSQNYTTSFELLSQAMLINSIVLSGQKPSGRYTIGDVVTADVTFSDTLTIAPASSSPQLDLQIGASTAVALYREGSGTNQFKFVYTVGAGQNDANGISVVSDAFDINGANLQSGLTQINELSSPAVTDQASLVVDTVAPTVTSVALSSATGAVNSTLNVGDVVMATVVLSEAATVTGIPQLALDVGGTTALASYVQGSGTNSLKFAYTVQVGQNDTDGIGIAANALGLNSGSIVDDFGNLATLTHAAVADNSAYKVEAVPPTISTIALTAATGIQSSTLNTGDIVTATVNFSEAVTVTGTPQLALDIGGTTVQANYASGSGTADLKFIYTIQAGQNDANGISFAANAPGLNSGSIVDGFGNSATLTHTAVADNSAYKVEAVLPTISTIALTSASTIQNSTINIGSVVTATVNFSEAVTVTGLPKLALDIGGTTVQANYASGSGTADLKFIYTIQAGQNDANGISIAANVLGLNSGSIVDSFGNNAMLTHAAVADNSAYKVEAVLPTISTVALTAATGMQSSTLNTGDIVTATVNFSEAVTVTGTPQLALNIGGTTVQANYALGSGTADLKFIYTIQAGQNDANGISIAANALGLNSGSIVDGFGNNATLTHTAVADNSAYKVEAVLPTISTVALTAATGVQSSTLNTGDIVTATVNFSEAVTVIGIPQLALDIGGTTVQANYASGSGTADLKFIYTIQAGQNDANGISFAANALGLNSGSIVDGFGNSATLTHTAVADNSAYKVEAVLPTISTVALTAATGIQNSTLNTGDIVTATVNFSEAVTVTGTPQLALNVGGITVQANYASGTGTINLKFVYTIQAGQNDVNGISIAANALGLNSGSIVDSFGNGTTLTHAAVADNSAYKVDTMSPVFNSGDSAITTENIYGSVTLYTASAFDNSSGVYYVGLSGVDANLFSFVGMSNLQFLASPDYEVPLDAGGDNIYNVNLVATDFAGNMTTQPVAITVTDVATVPHGQSVIDLGTYGKLISPVQVEGAFFYYWDRSGDGTSSNVGSLNGGSDLVTHDVLDSLFQYAPNFTVLDFDNNTDEVYRYATLNGIRVALPVLGGVAASNGSGYSATGNSVASNTEANGTYDGLLAIWDAFNGGGIDAVSVAGVPTGWHSGTYWSANSSASGHASLGLDQGYVRDSGDSNSYYVALQVL